MHHLSSALQIVGDRRRNCREHQIQAAVNVWAPANRRIITVRLITVLSLNPRLRLATRGPPTRQSSILLIPREYRESRRVPNCRNSSCASGS